MKEPKPRARPNYGTPEKEERNRELTELRVERRLTLQELGERFEIDPARVARLIANRVRDEEDYKRRLEAVGLWPPRRGRRPAGF